MAEPGLTDRDFGLRLDGDGPLGVAVSGGGDSLALLYALHDWGRRPLHVFCVDHGLNPDSQAWTEGVANHANTVGAEFTALNWQGDKPGTGLSAAARQARHRMLAQAARKHGIRVLCLGHTRDDIAEAGLMRKDGSNVTPPQEWAPSPAWPEGRGVFLYRPFLDVRRHTLRAYLKHRAVAWLDDPANADPRSARVRARLSLPDDLPPLDATQPLLNPDLATALIDDSLADFGLITFRSPVFDALPQDTAIRLLSAAIVSAGGGNKLPRRAELESLISNLAKPRTLAGARIWRDHVQLHIAREPGDIARHPRPDDDGTLWDGRFAVSQPAVASGAARPKLNDADRSALLRLPVPLRASQPVVQTHLATNPALRHGPYNSWLASCWVLWRFLAVAGLYIRESDLVSTVDATRR